MLKTKEEILKMNKEEIKNYKWSIEIEESFNRSSDCSGCLDCSYCSGCSYCSDCLDCSGCSYCSDCLDCSYCSGCSYCSDCSYCWDCRNVKGLKYAICNVEIGKKDYEEKIKELKKNYAKRIQR